MSEAFKELKNFDDAHLKILNRMIYDHWTWDSGDPKEKILIDAIEVELQERGMGSYATPPYDSEFYNGTSYAEFENSSYEGVRVGAGQYNNELVIKGANGIKFNGDEIISGISGGLPSFGSNLEMEIRRLVQEEVHNMTNMTISKNPMDPLNKDGVREVAREEINNKLKKIMDVS